MEKIDEYGRTKLIVSFEGIVEGVGGLGDMNADGVLGGSILGMTDLQPSTNFESTGVSAGTSVENGRLHLIAAALVRDSNRGTCLNISPEFGCMVNSGRALGGGRRRKRK